VGLGRAGASERTVLNSSITISWHAGSGGPAGGGRDAAPWSSIAARLPDTLQP